MCASAHPHTLACMRATHASTPARAPMLAGPAAVVLDESEWPGSGGCDEGHHGELKGAYVRANAHVCI